jgi:hypothetical protein
MLVVTLEELDRGRPERGDAQLASLARDFDPPIGEIEPRRLSKGNFLSPGTRIVEEGEDRQIPDTIWGVEVNLSQDGFQFPTGKEFGWFAMSSLAGDGQDPFGLDFMGRLVDQEILEERLDGSQTLVAGEGGVAPSVVLVFEVLEEDENDFDLEITNGERTGGSAVGGEISDKQPEGITIAFEGVSAQLPLITEVGEKETSEMRGEDRAHRGRRRRRFFVVPSKRAAKRLSPSRKSACVMVRYTWVCSMFTWPMKVDRRDSLFKGSAPSWYHLYKR